jgi:hypothetical protein
MQYRIAQSLGDPIKLENQVNELIHQGWELYGDFKITHVSSGGGEGGEAAQPLYCQALIKE